MPPDLGKSPSDSRCRSDSGRGGGRPVSGLQTALWCAGRGWPVHPLAPHRKTPGANCRECRVRAHTPRDCPCIPAGRWCHGFHAATTDVSRIRAWWGRRPGSGVGVACGGAGLLVIDVDAHDAPLPGRERLLPGITVPPAVSLDGLRHGFHSLALLAALRGRPDPAGDSSTLRVRTPSGGMHIWYAARPGQAWRCSAGSSPSRALAWQVDVRAHGGYIIAPGTVTAAGPYTALQGARRPAPLPGWLALELARTGHLPAPPPPGSGSPVPRRAAAAVIAAGGGRAAAARALATVLAEVSDCAFVPEGAGFSGRLNRAAYTAGGLVGAGRLSGADAESALLAAALHARPAQERRALGIIRGAMNAGRQRPLMPGDLS
ncbi:bifunctional DNA primase/polymerase [Streptomyces sp. NPDC101490]|uniref:bifunctional DNA primase/polymerase n=1 Tax=Streptomyces sp. NPDC101490 TaxID=3366143 RepID=UPI0037FE9874